MSLLRLLSFVPYLFALLCLFGCGPDLPDGVVEAYDRLPERVDFNFHVKPILSDRCYACHGPDMQNQQAGLRLDTPEGAYAALESGGGVAIEPGSLSGSEMIRRITSDDPEVVMPTPESNLSLTDREIAILAKWVEQGAEYKEHWAFVAPERPAVPKAGADWAANDIDRFVAAKLEREQVTPSPEAERPYLIRRAYFDLTGLPPSLEDLDRWNNATTDGWYEKMVDELMASPAYGERMANYWMDVARFADSEGYLDDFHHEMWPYRDWVIKAYNENLPYNQFIEWQIAGDLMEEPSSDQVLATAFNRNHKQNSEGGIIPEEFRVEYVADRANTVGTAFMGLTVGCARCHDHKYDPFSQKNYYELFGFFNNTVERGDGIFSTNGVRNTTEVINEFSMNAGPTLPLPSAETKRIHEHLLEMIAAEEADYAATLISAPASAPKSLAISDFERYVKSKTVNHLTFDETPVREHAPGQRVKHNALPQVPGKVGRALEMGTGQIVTTGDDSRFERSDPFTVSFWIYAPEFFEEAHVLYNSNNRLQGYRGWDVVLDSNRVHLRLNHAHPYQSIELRIEEPLANETWTHVTWSYDGSSDASGMRVYRDGVRTGAAVMRNHLIRSTLPYYLESGGTVYLEYPGLILGGRHYDDDFAGGRIDEFRVLNVEGGDLIARYLYEKPLGKFAVGDDQSELGEYHALHQDDEVLALQKSLNQLRASEVTTIDTVREVMVMGDDTRLRPTYILNRGVYDEHGTEVTPGVPENLLEWPEGMPRNRLGLAKWLTSDDNPLTARVAVNQLWYVIYGRGLVESVEDFGNQGSLPSHPELLDWLALDFRESGWDVKRLVRMMVTSSTYKQSSKIREDLKDRDKNNYWLARAPRYRRSAEMIRDNALATAGLLTDKVGGASAFPYQPKGLWKEVNNHGFSPNYIEDVEEGLYRRSLYTFWKRNSPHPSMLTFDASLRGECQVRRQRSSTPLQALVLLNDPQIVEACRVLAANTLVGTRNEVEAADVIFRKLIGREPTPNEREVIQQYYENELDYFSGHPLATQDFLNIGYHETEYGSAGPARVAAMARVANTVMNSQEGYYKN